jgi:hypothetical protein
LSEVVVVVRGALMREVLSGEESGILGEGEAEGVLNVYGLAGLQTYV